MTQRQKFHTLADLCAAAERRARAGRPAAIGAFNISFYSQVVGILRGLKRAGAPAVLQATRGVLHFYGGPDKVAEMTKRAIARLGHDLPVCLHLDHGDEESARACVDAGFSSVMIDASMHDFETNLAKTAAIAACAHPRGVAVEGEYGKLEGIEEDIAHEKTTYADPERVPEFFRKTRCDALAIAYGTSHGPNKGSNMDALRTGIVGECYRGMAQAGLADAHFLVGHGSSTVPPELVAEINRYGGRIASARGIPMEKIKEGIALGLRKINIDTDLRLGITAAARKYLHDNPGVVGKHPATLGRMSDGFEGRLEMNVWGNVQNPFTVIEPRAYFGLFDRELLLFPPVERDGLVGLMAVIEERVAGHVERLAREFGSAGLAAEVG